MQRLPRTVRPFLALSLVPLALGALACELPFAGQPEDNRASIDVEALPVAGAAIVDGRPAEANEILATVALVNGGGPFCTGTLIAPQVVVTAAHCLDGQNAGNVNVAAGVLNTWSVPGNNLYPVSQMIAHPSYNGGSGYGFDYAGVGVSNDIGIVLLSQPVQNVSPIAIMPMATFDAAVPSGSDVVISGYGITNLNTGSAGTLYIAQTPYSHRSASEFLAGNPQSPDSCNGDSGGPVYATTAQGLSLIGATSRAASNSQVSCGDGGIYSLVPAFESWIDDAAQDLYPVGGNGGDGTPLPPNDPPAPGTGGCDGFCGGQSDEGCYCDTTCAQYGDCCANIEEACTDDATPPADDPTPPASDGEWTCPANWISDGECDCGCGIQDTDCTAGTVEECLFNNCPNGEALNEADPSQCGAAAGDGDAPVQGDGDGDGDAPVQGDGDGDAPVQGDGDGDAPGHGDGDGDAPVQGDGDGDAPVQGDGDGQHDGDTSEPDDIWTCAQGWFGDGECDCGCGIVDSDCASDAVEECAYDGCDGEDSVPNPEATTECVQQSELPSEEQTVDNSGDAESGTANGDGVGDDRPDLAVEGGGSQFSVEDERSRGTASGCSAAGGSQTPMAGLGLVLLAFARRRRQG